MGYSQTIDLTDQINEVITTTGYFNIDVGNANYFTVHQVASSGATTNVFTSNDGGGIQGVTEDSAISATNFLECYGIDITANSPTNNYFNQLNNNQILKFINFGQYIQFTPTDPVTKFIVRLYNIY